MERAMGGASVAGARKCSFSCVAVRLPIWQMMRGWHKNDRGRLSNVNNPRGLPPPLPRDLSIQTKKKSRIRGFSHPPAWLLQSTHKLSHIDVSATWSPRRASLPSTTSLGTHGETSYDREIARVRRAAASLHSASAHPRQGAGNLRKSKRVLHETFIRRLHWLRSTTFIVGDEAHAVGGEAGGGAYTS